MKIVQIVSILLGWVVIGKVVQARRSQSRYVSSRISPEWGYCVGESKQNPDSPDDAVLHNLINYVKRPPKFLDKKSQQLMGEICSPWDYETYHYGSCCDAPALIWMENIFNVLKVSCCID